MPTNLMQLHVTGTPAGPFRHHRSDALRVAMPMGDPIGSCAESPRSTTPPPGTHAGGSRSITSASKRSARSTSSPPPFFSSRGVGDARPSPCHLTQVLGARAGDLPELDFRPNGAGEDGDAGSN